MANNHAAATAARTGEQATTKLSQQQPPAAKPDFAGKSFFLEIRSSTEVHDQIKFGIEALKGTVECFLSSDVKYIVTDRPKDTWPVTTHSNRDQSPGNNAVGANVVTGVAAAPVPTGAPSVMAAIQRAHMSRAKLMMDKSQQQQQQSATMSAAGGIQSTTTDLQRAVRLGVKPIESKRMMEFLKIHVKIPGLEEHDQSPTTNKSVQVVPLTTASYIKIEPVDQLTKPLVRGFRAWPDLILEPGSGCPFRPTAYAPEISDRMRKEQIDKASKQKQKQQQKDSNSRAVTPVPSPLPSPMPSPADTQLRSTPKDQQIRLRNICAGRKGAGNGVASWSRITPQTVDPNNPYTTAATGHIQTTNGGHFFRGPGGQIQCTGVKRKILFCEVCRMEFERLADHVQSHAHQKFLNDSDNFKELCSVISSLPKLSDLIAANMPVEKKVEEEKENETATSSSCSRKKKSKKKGKLETEPILTAKQNNELPAQDGNQLEDETDENEGTSAYDVTHLRERMSVATIASPVLEKGEPAWSLLNTGYDIEI